MFFSHFISTNLHTIALLAPFSFYVSVSASGLESTFSNASTAASPFEALTSSSAREFSFSPSAPGTLEKRQILQCSIPGGPICDAIHCCDPGLQCCPGGCCPLSANCFAFQRCCDKVNTICPGETACCPAGYSCCGNGCCQPGFNCERNECIDQSLKDRVVRFDIKENNREVLKNMCNGMRGKNTETLTYRGPDLNERDRTRAAAGCIDGFCADQIAKNLVPSNFTSCDEYPPASSLEGGNARAPIQRAINCIPQRQNSHQGGKFGGMQSRLRSLGANFQRGDKFVISIDCDKVLGDLVPPETPDVARREHDRQARERGEGEGEVGVVLIARGGERVSQSGNETVDPDVLNDDQTQYSFLLAPFGDLKPGMYTAKIQVLNGSTVGGYVLDNEGWNYTTVDSGLQPGQSQEYSFSLEFWTPGMAVFIRTTDNETRIDWTLDGTVGASATSTGNSSLPSPSPSPTTTNGAEGLEFRLWFVWTVVISLFLTHISL